ncbi:unnamed protein product [Rotaria socialis]|uniref:Uncharacterized protein n=2 Tax=Rotaria socialis TaxID=392032 RepID=A0A818XRQ9_9BILA|nr:unnamed protein product [Rotaria socialis]CAF4491565.1 unnamed protein product [Rotaria socialis]CAF4501778.1 unnamed protein product [Rotaria socialis]
MDTMTIETLQTSHVLVLFYGHKMLLTIGKLDFMFALFLYLSMHQLIFCSSLRQKSLQWIYAYIITDHLLLARFFLLYTVHAQSTNCQPSRAWVLFICYFQVIIDNYFNISEVYILLALNLFRYAQIVQNQNVYEAPTSLMIASRLSLYLIPLVAVVIPLITGWNCIKESIRGSCSILCTNIYIEIFNLIFAFASPILLNIWVICACAHHIQLKSPLHKT